MQPIFMFYPFKNLTGSENKFSPFIQAGHCFYRAIITSNAYSSNVGYLGEKYGRWTSAIQMGLGTGYALNHYLDLTLSVQYMHHLGEDLHAEVINPQQALSDGHDHSHPGEETEPYLRVSQSNEHVGWEGHLLTTLSFNVRIIDFIKYKNDEK